jgi:D-sedoheptulose 7-phosphate isomerase
MRSKLLHSINESIQAVTLLKEPFAVQFIESAAEALAACFKNGNKVIIAGNGGSLCDAAHFAEELTGVFRRERRALPAIALTEPGHLTCTANDLGFDKVFARGIEAYGQPGDVFVALTTSGNSANLVVAMDAAEKQGLTTIAFLGKGGGKLKGRADFEFIVNGFKTSDRIQEVHMTAIHIIIEMTEYHLFSNIREEMSTSVAASFTVP